MSPKKRKTTLKRLKSERLKEIPALVYTEKGFKENRRKPSEYEKFLREQGEKYGV